MHSAKGGGMTTFIRLYDVIPFMLLSRRLTFKLIHKLHVLVSRRQLQRFERFVNE